MKGKSPKPLDAPQAVAEFFDTEAASFPMVNSGTRSLGAQLVDRIFRRSLQLRYARVMALCQPAEGTRVLDIGCGIGTYSVSFAQRGATCVLGIDLAPQMISVANERAAASSVSDRCEFRVSSLDELQVTDPFQFVVAMGVLDYVPEASTFLRKAVDAAGEIACFSLPRREGLLAWQRRKRYKRRCPLYMYDRKTCVGLFDALGVEYEIERLARDWFVTVFKNRSLRPR